jgi:hypothetical protein
MAPRKTDDRCALPLAPDEAHNLTTEEVRLLWSFIHGDIMNEPTRVRLRKSWGLCGRHAWGSAVAEIELWRSGTGRRGGHQPFDAAVLCDDLLGFMTQAMVNSRARSRRKVLKGKGECIICDDVRAPALPGMALTHGGFTESVLAAEANSLTHTREWMVATAPVWGQKVCPECAAQAGRATRPAGERVAPRAMRWTRAVGLWGRTSRRSRSLSPRRRVSRRPRCVGCTSLTRGRWMTGTEPSLSLNFCPCG